MLREKADQAERPVDGIIIVHFLLAQKTNQKRLPKFQLQPFYPLATRCLYPPLKCLKFAQFWGFPSLVPADKLGITHAWEFLVHLRNIMFSDTSMRTTYYELSSLTLPGRLKTLLISKEQYLIAKLLGNFLMEILTL
jgi:hypothetical protein